MVTAPIPHSAFAGALWPAVPQTKAAVLLAVQQQLQLSQFLPEQEIRAFQYRQIGALVAHAESTAPYYRPWLRKAGIKSDTSIDADSWARLPILNRRAVQEAGEALRARELPPGHGRTATFTTSGTSGMPVTMTKSELCQFYWQCFSLREELWQRRDLSAKAMGIRRDDQRVALDEQVHLRRMPDWGPPISVIYPTGPSVLLDYRSTVADQVQAVLSERPGYLVVYPSILLELLRHCRANDIVFPDLLGITTMREALAPETRILCREVLGVDPVDIYSAAETGSLAFPCAEQGQYHVQSESVLFEILDENGRNCGPGEIGRVVVTPLHNFATPLLRYEIGDLVEVGEQCSCGRTLPVLKRIIGRARDMLVLPSGEKRYPYYGHNALVQVESIRQHQLVQKTREHIEIHLVVRHPLTATEEREIIDTAIDGLGHAFRITLVYRDEIARDSTGKYAEFRTEVRGTPS